MTSKFIVSLIAHLLTFGVQAAKAENPIEVWARHFQGADNSIHAPFAVSAILKMSKGKPILAFRFTNLSKQPLALCPWQLPWGSVHSITVAAFTPSGKRVPNHYPLENPVCPDILTIPPGQSMEGDYQLDMLLGDLPTNSDVVVIWFYKYFVDPKKRPLSATGALVIPKSK